MEPTGDSHPPRQVFNRGLVPVEVISQFYEHARRWIDAFAVVRDKKYLLIEPLVDVDKGAALDLSEDLLYAGVREGVSDLLFLIRYAFLNLSREGIVRHVAPSEFPDDVHSPPWVEHI